MRKEENPTDLAHFSDVWANAQISRSVLLSALIRKAWRRLFGSAGRDGDQPISNARQYLGA
jgi:hypothetical protein